MRLLRLTLQGYRQFRQWTDIRFPSSGLIGIVGPNGAGKSKIVEAVSYALFGPRGPHLPQGDHDADLRSYDLRPNERFLVALEFEVGRERYRVVRENGRVELYEGDGPSPQVVGAQDVVRDVQRRTNLKASTFLGTFVAQQRDVAGLLAKGVKDERRIRLVNELIGVAQVQEAIALTAEMLKARNLDVESAQRSLRLPLSLREGLHVSAVQNHDRRSETTTLQ